MSTHDLTTERHGEYHYTVGPYPDPMEAYLLSTQVGHVRLGNMVDPNYTIGAGIDEAYL
jgi:hypothetical protein